MSWTRGQIIGRGSTAAVSIATSGTGEVLAVKTVELSNSESLQREQEIVSKLSNPYVISYKGCDITREDHHLMYNLFMEYMPGGRITDHRIDEPMISYYTWQIVQGLEYLHSRNIVHCDIKGDNILIGESGAKIADLGCAKWVDLVPPVGRISGTPMFMAPEVARGEEQGFAADIWALGCTVIEMATGSSPWPNHDNPIHILYKIAFSDELPEFPNCLSGQAMDFLGKCLKRDPKERWTAKDLIKHPFLNEFDSSSKRITEDFNSISPTSILDQRIWNSSDETEYKTEGALFHLDHSRTTISSPKQRIRELNSGEPRWREEENWVTVRCRDSGAGECSVGDDDWQLKSGEVKLIKLTEENRDVSSYSSFISCSCNNKALVAGTCRDCCSGVMSCSVNFLRPINALSLDHRLNLL